MPQNLFEFEQENFADLNWMPMMLRYRLDVSGLKLPLISWQNLAFSERLLLLNVSFEKDAERLAWIAELKNILVVHNLAEPKPLERWIDPEEIPGDVAEKLATLGIETGLGEWAKLKAVQRHALCKLARGKKAEISIFKAIQEFRALFSSGE